MALSRCASPMPNGPMSSDGLHLTATDSVPMRGRCASPMNMIRSPSPMGTPMQSHYASPANSRCSSPMGSRTMHPSLSTTSLQQPLPSSGLQHTTVNGWNAIQPHIPDMSGTGNFAVFPDDHRQQLPAPPWSYGEALSSQQSEHFARRLPAPPVQGSLPSTAASQWINESRGRVTASGGEVRHHDVVAQPRPLSHESPAVRHQVAMQPSRPLSHDSAVSFQEGGGMVPTSSNLQDTMPGPVYELAPETTSISRLPPKHGPARSGKAYPESFPALSMHN